jgi:hypothetical protein
MPPQITTRTGLAIGVAGALAGLAITSVLRRLAKPVALGAVKQSILLQHAAQARWEELREDIEDLQAEAIHQLQSGADDDEGPRPASDSD